MHSKKYSFKNYNNLAFIRGNPKGQAREQPIQQSTDWPNSWTINQSIKSDRLADPVNDRSGKKWIDRPKNN
jgi:hypothetical protein